MNIRDTLCVWSLVGSQYEREMDILNTVQQKVTKLVLEHITQRGEAERTGAVQPENEKVME